MSKRRNGRWVFVHWKRVQQKGTGAGQWFWKRVWRPNKPKPAPKPKPSPATSLYTRAIALAAHQIGTKESPANSNKTKYGVWYGINGEPWCAIFVSWVLTKVGHAFKYAYVPAVVEAAHAEKDGLKVIPFTKVKAELAAGHVVLACYDWPGETPGIADHIGFVKDVVDSTNFHAIEGNTSPSSAGSQSNGGEVCLKLRPKSDVQAFVLVT
jgi:hypothetical protein